MAEDALCQERAAASAVLLRKKFKRLISALQSQGPGLPAPYLAKGLGVCSGIRRSSNTPLGPLVSLPGEARLPLVFPIGYRLLPLL